MDLVKTMQISAAGMQAQGVRMRIVAENIANTDSLATTPGGDPFRRKTVTFRNVLDRVLGTSVVRADQIGQDRSVLRTRYDPQHPAADPDGYVKLPNVNQLLEVVDMREAQRSYEANLGVIEAAKSMIQRAIDMLRS